MRTSRHDAASGTTTSFIVGLAIFGLAFAGVLTYVSVKVDREARNLGEDIELNVRARDSLRALTSTPGVPATWPSLPLGQNPDAFGLLKPSTEATLDVTKFHALEERYNTAAWYDSQAKALLGLDGYDFHLRAHPILRNDADGNLEGLSTYRVAYLGRHTGSWTPTPFYAPDATGALDAALLDSTGAAFVDAGADYTGPLLGTFAAGDRYPTAAEPITRHFPLRLAGFPHAVDADGSLGNESYWKIVSLQDFPAGSSPYIPAAERPPRVLTASNRIWQGNSEAWEYSKGTLSVPSSDMVIFGPIDLGGYQGGGAWLNLTQHVDGKSTGVAGLLDTARVKYWCVSGCTTVAWTTVPSAEWNDLPAGYANANPKPAFFVDSSVPLRDLLGSKVYVALSWDAGGSNDNDNGWFVKDVSVEASYNGAKHVLYDNALDYSTTQYDAVVVGSNADQSTFNDAATGYTFKHAITQWVKAGGDLLALGSDGLRNDWLAPTFTTNGPPLAAGALFEDESDLTHPVLATPNQLQYVTYTPYATDSYKVSNVFTRVLLGTSQVGGEHLPHLAVSNPNPTWRGTVVLTDYAPALPMADPKQFVTNLLAYARYDVLYLDWGGTVPKGTPVGSAQRTMLVDASAYRLGTEEASMAMYVWH